VAARRLRVGVMAAVVEVDEGQVTTSSLRGKRGSGVALAEFGDSGSGCE
jgi:hypothetical protein